MLVCSIWHTARYQGRYGGIVRGKPYRLDSKSAARGRTFASKAPIPPPSQPLARDPRKRLRNVSFWGHIDAGKTTLTEKVLYLANALVPPTALGKASPMPGVMPGDVDSGSTVTDFLEAERQRGITIQSAAVGPFFWSPKIGNDASAQDGHSAQITLVDTPGHIDFTIEVERTLRVVDGCVVLIDGVEGVEGQTEGVWRIAQRYNVRSHVVFINKLDRAGASVVRSIRTILTKGLHERPMLLQLPVFNRAQNTAMAEEQLAGLIDLTSMPLRVDFFGGKAGADVRPVLLDQAVQDGEVPIALASEAARARSQIIDKLSNLDETLLDQTMAAMDSDADGDYSKKIDRDTLRLAIRRQVILGKVLPVLCGSAAKGVGIQPVLDAVADFLPCPTEAGDFDAAQSRSLQAGCVWANVTPNRNRGGVERRVSLSINDSSLSLLAFKVVWDKRRGPMTFVRIYSGTLTPQTTLVNTTTGARERLSKILFVYADRHLETNKLEAGQIGVIIGFSNTRTGDTLVDARPKTNIRRSEEEERWAKVADTLALRRVDVPPPVFSTSIEAMSKSDEDHLSDSLDMLIRTDPSLRIDNEDSRSDLNALGSVAAASGGQTVLSGMGALHLEIAKDRLTNEFAAKARLSDVRVSYRETIQDSVTARAEIDRELSGNRIKASCKVTLRKIENENDTRAQKNGGNLLEVGEKIAMQSEQDEVKTAVDPDIMRRALIGGANMALNRGPLSANPVIGVHVKIDHIDTNASAGEIPAKGYAMLAHHAVRSALHQCGTSLMEPFMNVNIRCDQSSLGKVVSNLTSEQDGMVEQVDHDEERLADLSDDMAIYIPAATALDQQIIPGSLDEGGKCTVFAIAPLLNLVRYSSTLRALTKGKATYEMTFRGFQQVSVERQNKILQDLGR